MSGDLAKGSYDNRKKNYRKGKITLQKLDKRIKNVYRNIAQEVKVYDASYLFLPTRDGGSGDIVSLSSIAQGDSDITRDGLKIKGKSLQLKGQIYQDLDGGQSSTVRMLIVMDRNYENGVVPSVNQILEGGLFGTDNAPYAMRNRKERERFKIIYDKLFTLNNTGANTLPFNIYRRLNNVMTYSSTGNADYGKNMLWLVAISGQSSDNRPTVNAVSRLSYTDS